MKEIIKERTKRLGIAIIHLIDDFPNKPAARTIAKQITKSATSIGANYRAACRAKSDADFIHKLKIVGEEADETAYWLEIIEETKLVENTNLEELKNETNEILKIVVSTIKTKKSNMNHSM